MCTGYARVNVPTGRERVFVGQILKIAVPPHSYHFWPSAMGLTMHAPAFLYAGVPAKRGYGARRRTRMCRGTRSNTLSAQKGDEGPLWTEHVDESGRLYYHNASTGVSVRDKPIDAPAGSSRQWQEGLNGKRVLVAGMFRRKDGQVEREIVKLMNEMRAASSGATPNVFCITDANHAQEATESLEEVEGALEPAVGDWFRFFTIESIVAACKPHIVICAVQGSVSDDEHTSYMANRQLMDACVAVGGVERFVMLSALGAGSSEGTVPAAAKTGMRPIMLDLTMAERRLEEKMNPKGLSWSIVRAGPISSDPYTGASVVTESMASYGTVGARDVAEILMRSATSPVAEGKILAALDRTKILITTPYVRQLMSFEPLPFEAVAL